MQCAAEMGHSNVPCGQKAGREVAVICPKLHVRVGAVCPHHEALIEQNSAYCIVCRNTTVFDHNVVTKAEPGSHEHDPLLMHVHG